MWALPGVQGFQPFRGQMTKFIEMPAREVRSIARKCLERIEDQKKNEWSRLVSEERIKRERSFLRKLSGKPVGSDKEIQSDLRRKSSFIDFFANENVSTAQRLLREAAEQDTVVVSSEDLETIR
jgi:hypothetical protein